MEFEKEYRAFTEALIANSGNINPVSVGVLIVKFGGYFATAVERLTITEFSFKTKIQELENSTDEAGKFLSSAKANSKAEATTEYQKYIEAKGNVSIISTQIEALKSLLETLKS